MKRLNVMLGRRHVGELLAQDGAHYFSYSEGFLQKPLPLSPYELPAVPGTTRHTKGYFATLPGLVYDSLPDRFGMSVLRAAFRAQGVSSPSPLQMLSYLGERTMGALSYEPCKEDPDAQQTIDLISAAQSAKEILAHEHGEHLDPAIVRAGGTAGGATPKLLAAISEDTETIITGESEIPTGMQAWLIKLNTAEKQAATLAQLEHAYFQMARTARIQVPNTQLISDANGVQHFAIERFDRDLDAPNQRVHIHSYAAMAGLDFSAPDCDYEDLLRLTKHLTRNFEEVCEQFRRMLFNLLACNRDDHAKNFSFQIDESGQWSLTPAYDLLYTDNELGGNWMLVSGKRSNIRYDDLLKLAELMGVSKRRFDEILSEVQDALTQWPDIAKQSGVGTGLRKVVQAVHEDLNQQLKQ